MNRLQDFDLLHQLTTLFDVAEFPWYVAGGWAVDLFLGRVTQPHGDIEVLVFREDQERLRNHLRTCRLSTIDCRYTVSGV